MCCRVVIEPVAPGALDLLLLAGFQPAEGSTRAWVKRVEDGVVKAALHDASIELSLQPAIATMKQHATVAQAAAIMFKVADRLAELGHGTITHASNIGECAAERHSANAVIARYPGQPLRYEQLCLGFRTLFGSERSEAEAA